MATNISKYVSLNDFILLEYEFNKSEEHTELTSKNIKSYIANTIFNDKQYFNMYSQGYLNNDLHLNSLPVLENKSQWFINPDDTTEYWDFFQSYSLINQSSYPFDTIKIHVESGYNFDDISGFLLQVKAEDVSSNLVTLSNFTWINQVQGTDVLKFSNNNLFLAGKYYDKYIELKVPSVQKLGGSSLAPIEQALMIKPLSDIFLEFNIIPEIDDTKYIIQNRIELQLPVSSNADNFNAFISESTEGDYIEFYATWKDSIIGNYIGDIESGRIKLFTSSDPNDNYDNFVDLYGNTNKWIVMHEIYLYEHIPGSSILTQQYVFSQDDNFNTANYFRPIIRYADVASSYTIDYVCRLTNRMDGTQIIRKASFASVDPKKYGKKLQSLNVDNMASYKIFNRIDGDTAPRIMYNEDAKVQYVKVFYDTTNIYLNMNNEVMPQGTGALYLKQSDGFYKFSFKKVNENNNEEFVNVDLSGAYQYSFTVKLDNGTKIEINPSFSENMNLVIGEIEFKITEEQSEMLRNQSTNIYSIVIKNTNGTTYTLYQGKYYDISKK